MGEVLSQSEIDNLLKALNSGELDIDEAKNTEEKQVKNYDFARPAKFSKEHLRTLEIIYEHFARLMSTISAKVCNGRCCEFGSGYLFGIF